MLTHEIHTQIDIPKGGHLATTITKPPKGSHLPAIIFLTGSGGAKERFQDIQYFFSNKGYYTLAFDFRGRGASSGQPGQNTLRDQQFDLKHIMSFVTHRQPVNLDNITLFGTSMGAFVAASIANEIPIRNLILSAPALYMPEHELLTQVELNNQAKSIISNNKKKITQSSSFQHLSKYSGRLLILEHENDTIIPQWLCQKYHQAATQAEPNDHQVLKDVEHPILTNKDWKLTLSDTIYSWLSSFHHIHPSP